MSQPEPIRLADRKRRQRLVVFDRGEINRLLSLYSRQVARGQWRDYAIDVKADMAVFAVYRHSFESPLFRIVKRTASGERACAYQLFAGGRRVASAGTIDDLLAPLDNKLRLVGV